MHCVWSDTSLDWVNDRWLFLPRIRSAVAEGALNELISNDDAPTPHFRRHRSISAPGMVRGGRRGGRPEALGFRFAPGGVHLTKTMMLAELTAVLNRVPDCDPATVQDAVIVDNLLGKPTGTARRLALSRLNALYGILKPRPIQIAALRLWPRNVAGRPLLALLCALAREPLLRQSAPPVLDAPPGASVRWPDLASAIAGRIPGSLLPEDAEITGSELRVLLDAIGPSRRTGEKATPAGGTVTRGGGLRGPSGFDRRLRRPGSSPIPLDAPIGSFGSRSIVTSPPRRVRRACACKGRRRRGTDRRPPPDGPTAGNS